MCVCVCVCVCVCIYHIFSVCSSNNRHLAWFHVLSIVNSTSISMWVKVFPCGANHKDICQCRKHKRHGIGKIPRRRAWQPTPACLSGESQRQGVRQAIVHSVSKESETNEATLHTRTRT